MKNLPKLKKKVAAFLTKEDGIVQWKLENHGMMI